MPALQVTSYLPALRDMSCLPQGYKPTVGPSFLNIIEISVTLLLENVAFWRWVYAKMTIQGRMAIQCEINFPCSVRPWEKYHKNDDFPILQWEMIHFKMEFPISLWEILKNSFVDEKILKCHMKMVILRKFVMIRWSLSQDLAVYKADTSAILVNKYESDTSATKDTKYEAGTSATMDEFCRILSSWRALNLRLKPPRNGRYWADSSPTMGDKYDVDTSAKWPSLWGWDLCPDGQYKANTSAMKGNCMRLKPLPPQAHLCQTNNHCEANTSATTAYEVDIYATTGNKYDDNLSGKSTAFLSRKNILRHWFISSSVNPYIWGWYPRHDGNNYEAKLPQCATWSTTGEMYKGR